MREFDIVLRSLGQIQDFVKIATNQPFEVKVGNEWQDINGKDLMGMFSLDYCRPLRVSVICSEEEYCRFRQQAAKYLAA